MVDLLANFRPIRDPSAPELSGVMTYTFRVIGGADSTAPSGGHARRRYPAPQQYSLIFQKCIGPDIFSWIRHYVVEVCALPSALLVTYAVSPFPGDIVGIN